jgi:hypothetical protein
MNPLEPPKMVHTDCVAAGKRKRPGCHEAFALAKQRGHVEPGAASPRSARGAASR